MNGNHILSDDWEIYEGKRETLTFPEAVEALKQGKCVRHESWEDDECINSLTSCVTVGDCISGKWEIYEEPQEEPEMKTETVIRLLQEIKTTIERHEEKFEKIFAYFNVSDAIKALDFAIESLENQNQTEKKCECKCLDKLEEVYKFIEYMYTECEFTPSLGEKFTTCYESLKDFLYYQRKRRS